MGVVGIAEVVKEAYPDHFQFDPESDYFDPKSTPDNPRWMMVDIEYRQHVNYVSLARIKANPALEALALVKKGSRLSIMPVSESQWCEILAMAEKPSRQQ